MADNSTLPSTEFGTGEVTPIHAGEDATNDDETKVLMDVTPEKNDKTDVQEKMRSLQQQYIDLFIEGHSLTFSSEDCLDNFKQAVSGIFDAVERNIKSLVTTTKLPEAREGQTEAGIVQKLRSFASVLSEQASASKFSGGLEKGENHPWDAHIRATWKHLQDLATDIFPDELLDAIISMSWLTDAEVDSIVGKSTPRKKTEEMLLALVPKLKAEDFKDEFLPLLRKSHEHLADKLEDAVEGEKEAGKGDSCLVCLFWRYVPVKYLAPALQRKLDHAVYSDLTSQTLSDSTKRTTLETQVEFEDVKEALRKFSPPMYEQFELHGVSSFKCCCCPPQSKEGESCSDVGIIGELSSNPELDQRERAYCMSAEPRGRCIIISNRQGSSPNDSKQDENKITTFFQELQFNVSRHWDLTAEQMEKVLADQASDDHSRYDCFVCFVLSPTTEKGLCGVDGSCLSLERLAGSLLASRCPSLAGKPKLFLHQGPRGERRQNFVVAEEDVSRTVSDWSDVFLGYSTTAGYSSASGSKGSAFVSSLLEVLRKHEDEDFLSCVVRVGGLLDGAASQREGSGPQHQVPIFHSSLRKPLFLSKHPTPIQRAGTYRLQSPESATETKESCKNSLNTRRNSLPQHYNEHLSDSSSCTTVERGEMNTMRRSQNSGRRFSLF